MLRIPARRSAGGSSLLVAVLLLAAPQAHAQAVVIDFESLACSGTSAQAFAGPYLANGFAFASSVNNPSTFANWCTGNSNFAGSTAMFQNFSGATTTLTKVGGGAFALNSIKLANVGFNTGVGQSITFTGWLANSTQIFQTFVLASNSGTAPVLTQFQFNSAFQDVVAVSWAQASPFHQFDDVSLNLTAVPEPMTAGLLASGLVAMAGAQLVRRRRRA